MSSLKDLLAQRVELEKRIETAQKQARGEAVAKVRALMDEYGLTLADLNTKQPARKNPGAKGGKVAVKYRDAATGDTWTGRGLQPKWLKSALAAGRKLDEFRV
jgi:DNA-binding protein H-NS